MPTYKDTKDTWNRTVSQIRWGKLIIVFIVLIIASYGLAMLLNYVEARLDIEIQRYQWVAYTIVFVAQLVTNMTIIAPVPFAVVVMVSAANTFNPVVIALIAATGGSLGELTGYYAGRLGSKLAIPESMVGYKRLEGWIHKNGFWGILILAFQPIIPFDLGGIIAGVARMPMVKFLPALWLGKFPKCLILIYSTLGVIKILPKWLLSYGDGAYGLTIIVLALIWLLVETKLMTVRLPHGKSTPDKHQNDDQ